MRRKIKIALLSCFALFLIVAAGFYWIYRPWALSWGSTDVEVARAMDGDAIVRDPTFNATRAVSIDARPEDVWPWIVQIGYRRAGFYSYDRLDNAKIPSAERILPQYQSLKVGDPVPMGQGLNARVTSLVQNEVMTMVFSSHSATWSWTWKLEREGPNRTRLVTRLRINEYRVGPRLMLDAVEIVMMRKCLLGIKRRAESLNRSLPLNSVS